MSDLASHIAAFIAEWPENAIARICGTDDPDVLATRFNRWCGVNLASSIARTRFFAVSVGPVAGVELDDGRAVVVKAHRSSADEAFLRAARRVQSHLAANGFPCPMPLTDPQPFGATLAVADSWLDDPQPYLGAGAMTASAEGLARVVELAREVDGVDALERYPMRRASGRRYPEPHSPIFDFSLADDRVPFVDALADRALAVLDRVDAPAVVAHGDWSARNVRMGPTGVRAVYDWDSLLLAPEAIAVGVAAATWRSHGEADDPIAPDPAETVEYLGRYEHARGGPFPAEERHAVLAQALYCLCYTARCEMSLGAASARHEADSPSSSERDHGDPKGHPRRAIGRLELDGEKFLAGP